jgi:hypothetical protein
MTPPLPLPVRLAAGLVATAVEQARDLPRLALELPVTAVSQALQASMRVQQKVTELAIKGDRVLGVGPQIEDEPAWATFDDDVPPARRNGRSTPAPSGPATVSQLRPASDRPAPDVVAADLAEPGLAEPDRAEPGPAEPDLAVPDRADPDLAAPDPFDEPGPVDPGSVDPGPPGREPLTPAPADGPGVLPGYAELTIPQLRGKLRHLGVDDLRALLSWEQAHGDRPPYVTMLSNRIATISGT